MSKRTLVFRARRVDTGEWVEGNWTEHQGYWIWEFGSNNQHEVYRESLQLANYEGKFENI